jgi:hypothetical protein
MTDNNTVEVNNAKQLKKRKLKTKRKNQSSRTLEKFLHEMLQRNIETVNRESAMLNQLVTQLEAILLNIKLKLKYNDLQLSLQEYKEKISQSNLSINLDSILQNQHSPQSYQNQYNPQLYQNQYNLQPQQNTKQSNYDSVSNSPVKPKLPDLSAFNSDGTAVLPDGELFTSTPLIT